MKIGDDEIEFIERSNYHAETVSGEIILDNKVFTDVTFNNCILKYNGGPLTIAGNTKINGGEWHFDEAAGNTVQLMKALAKSSPLADNIILNTFKFPVPLHHRIYGFFYKHFRRAMN